MQVDKVNSTNNVSFPCQPLKEDEKLAELKQKPDVFVKTEKYDPIKAYEEEHRKNAEKFKQIINSPGKFSKQDSNISYKGEEDGNNK